MRDELLDLTLLIGLVLWVGINLVFWLNSLEGCFR